MKKPIIVLDGGHGGKDSGAVGPRGLRESDVVLNVVTLLGVEIANDFTVVYTRRDDSFVELSRRATIANDAGANAFLSVHCNSGSPGSGDGFEVFTSPGETNSDAMATDLFGPFAAEFPEKRKRMDLSDGDVDKEAQFTVLTRTLCRAVLFELEFIHTPAGEAWLGKAENQLRCAKALAAGLRKHFGILPADLIPGVDIKSAMIAKATELLSLANQL
ncbi:MAG: N-acetylmuramoyl-L-alanine amidase [Luteolibacter sp.]|nr:N-acetylmuramoyl-L-alanine amidase [Luteolibacter sp.]